MEKNQKTIIIIGPTSSGKTSLALDLCKKCGGEIISADSRQVYEYMDIGTGKFPVKQNLKVQKNDDHWSIDDVRIWGYDLVNPNEEFSAYDFALYASSKIKELSKKGKIAFVVGGTGFYINVLIGDTRISNIPPNKELRKELANMSLPDLKAKLEGLNLLEYSAIDFKNRVRLVRAIEKELGKNDVTKENFKCLDKNRYMIIGLTAPREILYERTDNWLDGVWKGGLLKEVTNLMKSTYSDSPKLHGLVYKSAISFLKNEINEQEAKQQAKFDLHAYIRRQQTYFKKMKNVDWLDITQDNYSEKLYNVCNG